MYKKNKDSVDLYPEKKLWNIDRKHRLKSVNDFAGDESLYKSSELGEALVFPERVVVRDYEELTFKYCTGKTVLPAGTEVCFATNGQGPFGAFFQLEEPLKDAYIHIVQAPDHCLVEPFDLGFIVKQGQLKQGDVVELNVSRFQWTPLAGIIEIKLIVRHQAMPERRLASPMRIDVLPGDVASLSVFIPGSFKQNGTIPVSISSRDRYDNRVDCSDVIKIACNSGEYERSLTNGLCQCNIEPRGDWVDVRVEGEFQGTLLKASSNKSIKTDHLNLYFGDLHCHDLLSQAERYPDQVYQWAINDKRLDFISVSQQLHNWIDNESWTIVKYMNERFLDEGTFVTLLAFEWQHSGYGDKIIHFLNGDQPFLPTIEGQYNTPDALYKVLANSDALVISHHPAYAKQNWCSSTDFSAVDTRFERLVELWSMHGSSEGIDNDNPLVQMDVSNTAMEALKRGLQLGFTGGSDTHSGRPCGSAKEPRPYWGGYTGVWAEQLTRTDIFNALFNRHTYALTGARIALKMTVNDSLMGSEIIVSNKVFIRIDCWAPSQIAKIQLIKNAVIYKEFDILKDEAHLEYEEQVENKQLFYHCRVVLDDGHLAVASPVWLVKQD